MQEDVFFKLTTISNHRVVGIWTPDLRVSSWQTSLRILLSTSWSTVDGSEYLFVERQDLPQQIKCKPSYHLTVDP